MDCILQHHLSGAKINSSTNPPGTLPGTAHEAHMESAHRKTLPYAAEKLRTAVSSH
jgi:hypothetical protein